MRGVDVSVGRSRLLAALACWSGGLDPPRVGSGGGVLGLLPDRSVVYSFMCCRTLGRTHVL